MSVLAFDKIVCTFLYSFTYYRGIPRKIVLCVFCLVEYKQNVMKAEREFLGKRKQMKRRGQREEEMIKVQVKLKKVYFMHA